MRALRPAGQTRPRPRPRPGAGRTQVVIEEVQEHQHGAAHDHEDAGHDGRHVHRLVLLLVRPVVTLVLHVPPGEAQAGGGAQPASQLGAPRAADAGRDGEVALRGTAHYLLRGPVYPPPAHGQQLGGHAATRSHGMPWAPCPTRTRLARASWGLTAAALQEVLGAWGRFASGRSRRFRRHRRSCGGHSPLHVPAPGPVAPEGDSADGHDEDDDHVVVQQGLAGRVQRHPHRSAKRLPRGMGRSARSGRCPQPLAPPSPATAAHELSAVTRRALCEGVERPACGDTDPACAAWGSWERCEACD